MPLPRLRRRLLATTLACALRLPAALWASSESPWSVRAWRTDDGLPNNVVTGLAQTADGYLWVATPGRLVRFDGVTFDEFRTQDFAPGINQRPVALSATPAGLWIGFDRGAVMFLHHGVSRIVTAGLPDRVVQRILVDAEDNVWVSYRAGVVARLTATGVHVVTASDGFPSGYVASLENDHGGKLWYGKGGQVGVYRNGHFDEQIRLARAPTRIAAARSGGIWICVGHELYRARDGMPLESVGRIEALPTTSEPTALLEDRAGGVWVGTNDRGLFRYERGRFESISTSHRAISALLEDREGSLWVGTDGGGLDRLRLRAVTLHNTATGLPFDTAQSITEDTGGMRWVATQNGLLAREANGQWEIMSANVDWPGGRPTTVAADATGGVWIGTKDFAVHHWKDNRYRTWRRGDGLVGRTVHALLVARNGDVWFGEESPDVVQRLRGMKLDTFTLPAGIRLIRAITEDARGDVWVGTSKGCLFRFHDGQVIEETQNIIGREGLRSIRYLRALPEGRLWIAYADEGLGLYHEGRFANVTMEHGLTDNNLSQVVPDGRGWLWVAGDHGMFKARESELSDVAAGRVASVRVVRFGHNEGLASLQANFGDAPGALLLKDGRIWMPMRTGLAVVDPGNERATSAAAPPVIVKRLLVNGVPRALFGGVMPAGALHDLRRPGPELRLAPDHRRVEIEYTALSHSAPENVRFRYRLEGFDDDWVEAGTQRIVRYSRLPAGSYRFQVKACNDEDIWSPSAAAIAFMVAPFFWQTWWFRLLALATGMGAAWGVVRQVLRRRVRALEQQTALDRERARIARDMHDDLGSRLTHVALLVELAHRMPADTREARMAQIASTVLRASESLDEIVWAINPVNDVFPRFINYVSQYAFEFVGAANIRCRVDLPDQLPLRALSPEVRHNVFLVVKEALNNVVHHAAATEVTLRATVAPDAFTLRIEDNGRGFSSESTHTGGNGLQNMGERMREIGGRLDISSRDGTGACLTLTLPWTRDAAPAAPARAPAAIDFNLQSR